MAQEASRDCGYRKVGGLYLMGEYTMVSCDRLPYHLQACPVCGEGIKFSRTPKMINPLRLLGLHDDQPNMVGIIGVITGHGDLATCTDNYRPCFVCDPSDAAAYIIWIGAQHYKTPADFINEAKQQGISRRLPGDHIPKSLTPGETVVYLAHIAACVVVEPLVMQQAMAIVAGPVEQPRLVDSEQKNPAPGIFTAFIPQRIEKLYWESKFTAADREECEKRGITPVLIKDGDGDHA